MISLACRNLAHEWRRFAAAVLTLTFSGLLILVQVGLLLGQLDAFTLPVKRSGADLWVTSPNIRSWDQSTIVPARLEGLFWSHPAVRDVREMGMSYADWRTGNGTRQNVIAVGISLQSTGSRGLDGFGPDTMAALSRPDTIVVDQADAQKIGAVVGETVEISGKRVTVGGFVHGFRATQLPFVFASQSTLRQIAPDAGGGPPYYLLSLDPRSDREQVRLELETEIEEPAYSIATPDELTFDSALFWIEDSGTGSSFGFSMFLALLVGIGVTGQTLRGAVIASLKEYATLRALGIQIRQLRGIVLEQTLWIALAGNVLMFAIAGAVAGLASLAGVAMVIPWWLALVTVAFVTGIACVSGVIALSALYRSEPADLLR